MTTDLDVAPRPGSSGSHLGSGQWRVFSVILLAEVTFIDAIWILYLRSRGLTLAEVGLAEAAFHLAPLTPELPTGSLADVLGRKWSIALGALFVAISSALLWATTGFWMALPAMYLTGASYTFRSGAEQAFLYDALAEQGATTAFARLFGRLRSVSYLLVAGAAWAGGALAGISYAWPFGITIAVSLVRVWLAVGLREPGREIPKHQSVLRNMGDALRIIKARPPLAALLAYSSIFWTFSTLVGLYVQAVLGDQGLATSNIGLIVGASWVVSAVGGWFAHRISGDHQFFRWTVALTILGVAGGIALGAGNLWVAIPGVLVAGFVAGLFEPVLANRVNEGLPSAQRATILSVESFLFSACMIWAFPLAGWVAGRWGWVQLFSGAGVIVVVLMGCWLIFARSTGVNPDPDAA